LKTKKDKICNNRIDESDDIKNNLIINDEKYDDTKTDSVPDKIGKKICNINDNISPNLNTNK
jgi:hypothetical protein